MKMKKIYYLREEKGNEKKKSKIEIISIVLSSIAIFVSVIFFWITRNDVQSIREQDRNDFYSINSSMLKLDTNKANAEFNVQIQENEITDSILCKFKMNLKNISQYRVDLMGMVIFDNKNKLTVENFLEIQNEEILLPRLTDYSDKYYTVLPDDEIVIEQEMNVIFPHLSEEFKRDFKIVILYKNALGGFYAMIYNYGIEILKEKEFIEPNVKYRYRHKIIFSNEASSFKIFTLDQFPLIKDKLKKSQKYDMGYSVRL